MRTWVKEYMEVGNKKIFTYVIRCGSPGCDEISVGGGNIGRHSAHDALPKIFGQKGWTVGSKDRQDRCPRCTRKRAERQHAKSAEVIPMSPRPPGTVGFLPNASAGKEPSVHIHPAAPPDVMSKQDRRVIINKLEEVYIDEHVGYGTGWDDQKVATDLGVPLAWVAEVRDQNFGPNKSEQATKLMDEGTALLAEVQALYADAQKYYTLLKDAMTGLGKLGLRVEKFDKDLKDLAKRSSK